jgi:hypothetical protein
MMRIFHFDESQVMTLLPLGAVVTMVLFLPQAEAPSFRAEAYVIPFYFTVSQRHTLSQRQKPVTDLTVANFKIVVDKKVYVPVDVEQDPNNPGRYTVSFKPSDDLRDGLVHDVELKMKKGRMKTSTHFPTTIRKLSAGSRP